MSFQQEIEDLQKQIRAQIPEDVLTTLVQSTERLVRSGIEDQALRPGDKAPAFTLPNTMGQPVSSVDLLAKGPLVVSFYRGEWCPYCNLELAALQRTLPEIREFGGQLVAVSPQTPDRSVSTQEKQSLSFEVFSDSGSHTARAFGLVFSLDEEIRPIYRKFGFDLPLFNGVDSWELPLPATYIISPTGTIVHAFISADYTRRMDPSEIVLVLKALGVKAN